MKKYKYSQLSQAAKKVAKKDYQKGWNETHNDKFSDIQLDQFCKDSESDVLYNKKGKAI